MNLRLPSARNLELLIATIAIGATATACEYVIAEVEELVETGEIDPDEVMLPGIFVHAVVHVPREMSAVSPGNPVMESTESAGATGQSGAAE